MKHPQSHLMKNERGQALIEFALTLPMLLVVMFMITEFGRALFQYNLLAQASREGARVAVVNSEDNAPNAGETRIDEFLAASGLDTSTLERTVTVVDNYNESGTKVVISNVQMPVRFILQGDLPTNPDGAAKVSPGGITLNAETVMKAETF